MLYFLNSELHCYPSEGETDRFRPDETRWNSGQETNAVLANLSARDLGNGQSRRVSSDLCSVGICAVQYANFPEDRLQYSAPDCRYHVELGSDVWQIAMLIFIALTDRFPWEKADITDPR